MNNYLGNQLYPIVLFANSHLYFSTLKMQTFLLTTKGDAPGPRYFRMLALLAFVARGFFFNKKNVSKKMLAKQPTKKKAPNFFREEIKKESLFIRLKVLKSERSYKKLTALQRQQKKFASQQNLLAFFKQERNTVLFWPAGQFFWSFLDGTFWPGFFFGPTFE